MITIKHAAMAVASLVLTAQAAIAVPVVFERSIAIDTIVGTNTAGLSVADILTFQITADNGGGVADNDWDADDVLSATVSSGTFSGVFNTPFIDPVIFSTARDTTVTTAFWFDGDENNTDSVNGTANFLKAGNNGLLVSDNTVYLYSGSIFNDATEWTASVVPAVPLPAGMPLMLLTLGGLGVVAARRKTT